jgi:hypothetical protein
MNQGDWMPRPTVPGLLAVLLCALIGGCGSDPSQSAEQTEKALRAWSATLRLATEQWVDHRVPDLYFRQVLQAATESIDEQSKSLSKAMSPSDGRRRDLESRLAGMRHRVEELSQALDHSDRAAAETTSRGLPGGAAS